MTYRDRIVDFRRVAAGDLVENPRNWRTHPDTQVAALKGILSEVGWADAVLARETKNGLELIDGHLRKAVSPDSLVPVLIVDLNREEADKLLLAHDPLADLAGADKLKLDLLMESVDFDDSALDDMIAEMREPLGPDTLDGEGNVEGELPSLPTDPITKPGQLWSLGRHRLLCGDSTSAADVGRLMDGKLIHVAITSPPYASQRRYDESSGFEPIHPDNYVDWFDGVQRHVASHLKDDGSWFVNIKEHCEDGQRSLYVKELTLAHVRRWSWRFVEEYIWTKPGTPKKAELRFKNGWEPILQFTKGPHKFRPKAVRHPTDKALPRWGGSKYHPSKAESNARLKGTGKECFPAGGNDVAGTAYPSNVLSLGTPNESLGHPAAYPVNLPAFFIKAYSDEGDRIYDPFIGSGTTLIAAEQLNRSGYGMEISPAYCDVTIQRWERLTGGTAEKLA